MCIGKFVEVDEYMLDLLKGLLGIDNDVEAVGTAIRRIIELEETLAWCAEMRRLSNGCEDWEPDPDSWSGGD